jgi:hypothetical protein
MKFNDGQTLTGELIDTLKKLPALQHPNNYPYSINGDLHDFKSQAHFVCPGGSGYGYGGTVGLEEDRGGNEFIYIYLYHLHRDSETTHRFDIYIRPNDSFLFRHYEDQWSKPASRIGEIQKDFPKSQSLNGGAHQKVGEFSLNKYGLDLNKVIFSDGSSITEDGLSGKFVLNDHDGNSLVVRALDGQFAFCPVEMNGECTEWLGIANE